MAVTAADDWVEAARIEPSERSGDTSAQVRDRLDAFLADRGLSREAVTDSDLRIDNVYLGPQLGVCAIRLMVRAAALNTARE